LLKEYEKFLSIVFSCLSKEITSTVKAVGNQIANVVTSKDQDYFTEDVAKVYCNYSRHIDAFFRRTASSFLLYIQTLPELCRNPYLISSISDSCLEVVKTLVEFLHIVDDKYGRHLAGKKKPEDSDSEAEDEWSKDDVFQTTVQLFSRKICWLTGSLAHNLVIVKPEEINQDIAKREAEKERMARLLMSSKLLSGGIENRHMNLFTQKTKDTMSDVLHISNDFTLLELLTIKDTNTEDDDILAAIVHPKKNEFVEYLIEVLHHRLVAKGKKSVALAFALTGGQEGLTMSRAAFAPLIKFTMHTSDFISLVDELDVVEADFMDDTDA